MGLLNGLARLGLPLLLLSANAVAHELDLSLNANSFRAGYAASVGSHVRLEAGWLADSDEGDVVHGSFLVGGDADPGGQKLRAGIGVRLAWLDGEGGGREGYALGVGGTLRWILPRLDRFALSGEYYWAPEVLSGGDAEKYVDGTIRLGYSVTRQAELYAGARYTGADYEDEASVRFDTGFHGGFTLRF